MTHTPGPWRVEATTNPMEAKRGGQRIGLSFAISSGSSGHTKAIGSVADSVVDSDYIRANDNHLCMFDEYTSAEDIANARLIAAAPDLLETLKSIARSKARIVTLRKYAEAAIAKAEEVGA
jgi:hypothetical protein